MTDELRIVLLQFSGWKMARSSSIGTCCRRCRKRLRIRTRCSDLRRQLGGFFRFWLDQQVDERDPPSPGHAVQTCQGSASPPSL